MRFNIDHLPFWQSPHRYDSNRGKGDIRYVVIHDMEAPEKSTTAEAVARYFQRKDSKASAHVNVDNDSIIRSVEDRDVAWHAGGGNREGLGIEMAGYARQSREEWLDAYSMATMDNAAQIAAQYCHRYGLNVKHLTDAELRAGHSGVVGHAQISAVYKKSTHTDPGKNFPWDVFMSLVRKYHNELTGHTEPVQRRFEMVIYGQRGTPDASLAFAAVDLANKGVATSNLGEARAARDRGELVVAVGPKAADDLGFSKSSGRTTKSGNKVSIFGKTGAHTMQLLGEFLD